MKNERDERYEVGESPSVSIKLSSATVFVAEGDPGVIEVSIRGSDPESIMIDHFGDTVRIAEISGTRLRDSYRVALRVPEQTSLETSMASGSVEIRSVIGSLRSNAASGDISAGTVTGDATVKAASGDIDIALVGGRVRLVAASGDVKLGEAEGDCSCGTASGDIIIGEVRGDLDIKTASGDAEIERFTGHYVKAKSVSGDLTIGLPKGRKVSLEAKTLSGSVQLPSAKPVTEAESGPASVRIQAHSVSGDIRIVPIS